MSKRPRKKAEQVVQVKKPTVEQFNLLLRPVITEKSMALMQDQNKVTMEVHKTANKESVKESFEAVFGVTGTDVKIINTNSKKTRRVGRYYGTIPGVKKAVITVAEGQAIALFKE